MEAEDGGEARDEGPWRCVVVGLTSARAETTAGLAGLRTGEGWVAFCSVRGLGAWRGVWCAPPRPAPTSRLSMSIHGRWVVVAVGNL